TGRHPHRRARPAAATADGRHPHAAALGRRRSPGHRASRSRAAAALPRTRRDRLERRDHRRRAGRSAASADARRMKAGTKPGAARPKLAAGFLAGATSRLLPASIPLRYFGAAAVFHLAAWIALGAGAAGAPRFVGGLGWPLAALHFVTLGVLAMTAIGASLQLMPVATRQPVYSTRLPAAIWWVYTAGVGVTAVGMGIGAPLWLGAGAVAVVAGLIGYGVLTARNLAGARGMAGIVTHGWIALASLAVVVVSAVSLAFTYLGWPLFTRETAL